MPTPVEQLKIWRQWVEQETFAAHLDVRFVDALTALNGAIAAQYARKGLARGFTTAAPENLVSLHNPHAPRH